jgi:hypothetical protein
MSDDRDTISYELIRRMRMRAGSPPRTDSEIRRQIAWGLWRRHNVTGTRWDGSHDPAWDEAQARLAKDRSPA